MSGLKPEERAREWIDRKLEDAGWQVINRDEYAPGMTAVAVREAAMRGGLEADYLLLINGKAAAVLEAKREEIALDNPHLIAQAENYTKQVQPWYPTWEIFRTGRRSLSRIADRRMQSTKSFRNSCVRGTWYASSTSESSMGCPTFLRKVFARASLKH